jgi:hypothetical protein
MLGSLLYVAASWEDGLGDARLFLARVADKCCAVIFSS